MQRPIAPTPLILALLLCAPFAQAQQAPRPVLQQAPAGGHIPLLRGEIAIDGVIDEAAWSQALEQEIGIELQPGDNIAAPVRTRVRIGYSEDALYVAFDAHDPDPAQIRAHLRDRDQAFGDDWVGVFLDTFDDQRRAYELIVNPLGVQSDLIREEATGNEDPSWDGLWTSAGRLTADGYQVEVRIPFSTLRFRHLPGDKRWRVLLFRNWPRDKRHQLSSVAVPRGSGCFQCQWAPYTGLSEARQGRNLEVVPTLTVGTSQARDAAANPWRSGEHSIEPGLDVSWAPSPDATVNLTVNPDFSQVETDQLQLALNDSFALFYQEKRPFFLEGADYFNSQFNVLYTRQIADPDVGLRATGRTARGAYGAIVARDATTLLLVPGVLGSRFRALEQPANVAVGRYRHDLSPQLSVGAIATVRSGDDYANTVAGVDARWRKGAHALSTQVLRSDSQYPARIVSAYAADLGDDPTPAGSAWRAAYGFSSRHWSANVSHVAIDPGFRADLGFIGQVGYEKTTAGGGYTWFRDAARFNRVNVYADWDATHRHDGQLLERELEGQLNINGPRQSYIGLGAMRRARYWDGGLFDEHNLHLEGNFMWRPAIKLGTYMDLGRQLDLAAARTGRHARVGVWSDAAIGRSVNLYLELNRQQLRRDGGSAFVASVANLRGSWQVDPRQRLRLSLQGSEVARDAWLYATPVNALARDWAAQLVYSYKVNPRTALYAGASYGAFMDDDNLALFGNTRSMFVKLSYGWQP